MMKYAVGFVLFLGSFVRAEAFAEVFYVDCSAQTNGIGIYESPWNSISAFNDYGFDPGDDVYFKVNTTCTVSAADNQLNVHWAGVNSDNYAIIGAYHGNGQFGLDGNARPIIDGNSTYPVDNQNSLITSRGQDYVAIRDLHLIDSNGHSITQGHSSYGRIENCISERSYRAGMGLYSTTHSEVVDCEASNCYWHKGTGVCIEASHSGHHNAIRRNTVYAADNVPNSYRYNCSEGIGIYGVGDGQTYDLIEDNVVYDCSYSIYLEHEMHTTVRYNMVYSSSATVGGGRGIYIDLELESSKCFTGETQVYGNFIAGMQYGIGIANWCSQGSSPPCDPNCDTKNVLVYNNTLVDNDINIRVVHDGAGWSGNEIKNNISWTITAGMTHVNNYSPTGVNWSHNLFDDAVSGNAMTDAIVGDPRLSKTSGWRNLSIKSLTPNDFKLSSVVSAAHNTGADLGGTPYNVDRWGTNRDDNSPWDIGAHEYPMADDGGSDADVDVDADTDVDSDADAEMDVDGDTDVDGDATVNGESGCRCSTFGGPRSLVVSACVALLL